MEHNAIECVRQNLKGFRINVQHNCHPAWFGGLAIRVFTEDGNPVYTKMYPDTFTHRDAMRFVEETMMVIESYIWKLDYNQPLMTNGDTWVLPIDQRRMST